jgi:hypothetical protein
MVKGDCRFEVTIGEECELFNRAGVLENIEVIAAITPGEGEAEVSVFNAPQAVFNMAVDHQFQLVDEYDQIRFFKIGLDAANVKDGETEIEGKVSWNSDHTTLLFESHEILPPTKSLAFSVSVFYEEKINGNWTPVLDNGSKISETRSVTFTTGEAPDYIPENNVLYSYPLRNQYNIYKGESSVGYVQLKQGQDYLFHPGPEWDQKTRFVQVGNASPKLGSVGYDTANKRVSFSFPDMSPNKIYKLEIVNIPTGTVTMDQNVSAVESTFTADENITIETKTAEGTIDILEEKSLFDLAFRTSLYSTFTEKVNAINFGETFMDPNFDYQGVVDFGSLLINNSELFDNYELQGTETIPPLITLEATPDNPWLSGLIPVIYSQYPVGNLFSFTWRSSEPYGVPPLRTMHYSNLNVDALLGENALITGSGGIQFNPETIIYKVPYFVYKDLGDLQNQIYNYMCTHSATSKMNQIVNTTYPLLNINYSYNYQFKYHLPGNSNLKSSAPRSLKINFE